MHHSIAQRLCFVTEAQTEIELNERQGSAIRTALLHALRDRFCVRADDGGLDAAGSSRQDAKTLRRYAAMPQHRPLHDVYRCTIATSHQNGARHEQ